MRVLGIDTGISKIGWAIVDSSDGTPELVDFGLWSPQSTYKMMNAQTIDKMRKLHPEVISLIRHNGVTHIALEQVPMQRFGSRDKVLAIENMLRCIAIQLDIPYRETSARVVKKLATGDSKASKMMMKEQAFKVFPLMANTENMPVDIYDAINIAEVATRQDGNWWPSASLDEGGRAS